MPGFTAYIGLNMHGMPQKGETIVVGAATGAVGSLVGQLAKIQGLRVVGVAGGKEKCDYAVKVLGFDACLDHRSVEYAAALGSKIASQCPNGVDIYFENTAGKTFDAVLPLINVHGRIPLCGMISLYNDGGAPSAEPAEAVSSFPKVWRTLLVNRINVHGFIITDHYDQFPKFIDDVAPLIQKGKILYKESITIGLEKTPQAFIELLRGKNFGKQLVSISEDPTRY
jgi:NADPH-dependent curcumin reductase CurA